ncbi:MAG: lysophospholipid acyltransferase family protein [Planctomycetia bacterium]|nr:lysophospholipid acyltransferase family protein [Planctomycetia bacterium]
MKAPLHGMATPQPPLPADVRRGHSAFGCALYASLWVLTRMFAVSAFGFRVRFAEPLPKQGGLLVLSSHQSHLDPLLLGLSCHRRLSSMARSSLYRFKPFAAIITALDAIPIDREASTVAAIKGVINRLRDGAAVVIFPEGTRTADGKLGELKGGFVLLAKRAGVPIVPVAIVGAWECWLEFGRLLQPEQIAAMSDGEILSACTAEIKHLDLTARAAWESGRLK